MLAATLDVSWDSWEHGTQHLDRWGGSEGSQGKEVVGGIC